MSAPPTTTFSKRARAETESHGSDAQLLPSGSVSSTGGASKPPPKRLKDAGNLSSSDDSPDELRAGSDDDLADDYDTGAVTEEGGVDPDEDGVEKLARNLTKQGSSGPLTAAQKRIRYAENYGKKTPEEALGAYTPAHAYGRRR